jgi:ABC-type Mn2+/Zn2+ transport system permease subunit
VLSDFLAGHDLFGNAIAGGLGVALLCALLGVHLVLRRLVLIGVALPQASAAGVAAVFWLSGHGHSGSDEAHVLALAGSLIATFVALALLLAGARQSDRPPEWGVGALFSISSAATILFVAVNPHGDMEMAGLLRGELLAISATDLWLIGAVLLVVVAMLAAFRRELLLASFDPEFARTLGRNPARADALLFALLGSGIALGVMTAGPLVVFGFLVLPALAALRIAPGLGSAFAISAAIAAIAFLGGFELSVRADLPSGPVCVAVAAAVWGTLGLAWRIRGRAGMLAALVVVLLAPGLQGCASRFAHAAARGELPLPRGSLPELAPGTAIALMPFANATGSDLRISRGVVGDAADALGVGSGARAVTVADRLRERAAAELVRRGFALAPDPVQDPAHPLPAPGVLPGGCSAAARTAGVSGPALCGSLRRFALTRTGLLLVQLELVLVDAQSGELLWRGSARKPRPVHSALTIEEVLLDAGPAIFAEAFGST